MTVTLLSIATRPEKNVTGIFPAARFIRDLSENPNRAVPKRIAKTHAENLRNPTRHAGVFRSGAKAMSVSEEDPRQRRSRYVRMATEAKRLVESEKRIGMRESGLHV